MSWAFFTPRHFVSKQKIYPVGAHFFGDHFPGPKPAPTPYEAYTLEEFVVYAHLLYACLFTYLFYLFIYLFIYLRPHRSSASADLEQPASLGREFCPSARRIERKSDLC